MVAILFRRIQLEGRVERAYGKLEVLLVNDHGNLDFRGGDHEDVDAVVGQRFEHLAGHARIGTHAHPDNGYLGDGIVTGHFTGTDLGGHLAQYLFGATLVVAVDREGEVGGLILGHVLHDHVYFDIGRADRAEDLEGHAGGIRHTADGQFGFISSEERRLGKA